VTRLPSHARSLPRARRVSALGALVGVLLAVSSVTVDVGAAPAAANGPAMGFYLSAPFVQTPVYSASAVVETFNGYTPGVAPSSTTWLGISTSNGVVGTWSTEAGGDYGGATTVAAIPPGSPQSQELASTRSTYVSIAQGNELSIMLAEPRTCFGFWWSAGDAGNAIELYTDGGTRLVASLTTEGVVAILNGGLGTITARDGTTTYAPADYDGHPVSGAGARDTLGEPFAYVHAIADGGVTFDTIVLSQGGGGGFEFDNFAVGTGCDIDASFVTVTDDVLDPTFAASLETAPVVSRGPVLTCTPDPVVPGATVTCEITGGDPGIAMLWNASFNGPFAGAGVTLDAQGRGTFTFVAPRSAAGQSVTVELVDWTLPVTVGVLDAVLPTRLPAGEGGVPMSWMFAAVTLAGAGLVSRRMVDAG